MVGRTSLHSRRLMIFGALFMVWRLDANAQSLEVLHSFNGYNISEGPKAALLVAADGQLYGTTRQGGTFNRGTIFRMTPAGAVTVLHAFAGGDGGAFPEATLIQATDGRIYGTTSEGGAFGRGTAFRMESDGDATILHSFGGPGDAASPTVILQAGDGLFYGVARDYVELSGDLNFNGAAYRMTADGSVTILHVFLGALVDGSTPVGLMQSSNGSFIGTTRNAGGLGGGSVFRMTPAGTVTILHAFAFDGADGQSPEAGVIEATDGNFYGTTSWGGEFGFGTVFRMTSDGVVTLLYDFTGGLDGASPTAVLLEAADGNLLGTARSGLSATRHGSIFMITKAGALTVLRTLSGTPDGSEPHGGIVQTSDGMLYGTTFKGGTVDFGTVFTIDGAGTVDVVHVFMGNAEGAVADSALVEGTDGHFYGATCAGGLYNAGTVFRTTRTGGFTLLYTFLKGGDGSCPRGITRANDGFLYGTTASAGAFGGGTAFRIAPDGAITILHAFGAGSSGRSPGPLIQAADGHLYGTTSSGGASNLGTIFRMTLSGDVTVLHAFSGGATDGASPRHALLQASDGLFYGSTSRGGTSNFGTLFRITSSGTVSILHSFTGSSSTGSPLSAPLVEGTDHNLYGATTYRVVITPNTFYSCAVVFRVSLAGAFQVLASGHRCSQFGRIYTLVARRNGTLFGTEDRFGDSSIVEFTPGGQINTVHALAPSEGASVLAPLIESASGDLYGVAVWGGVFIGSGTIFRLRFTPLAPASLHVSATGSTVRLAWAPAAGATGYTIKRGTASGGETTLASGIAGTEYVDTTSVRGQTYYYIVTATNQFGESLSSFEVSIMPGRAIPGDFDGDGKTDMAVFRPSNGVWYIRQSSTTSLAALAWGGGADIPVPGDYDGDGQSDIAVFRPSTGIWYIRPSTTFTMMAILWGAGTDIPVPGDYDGDGRTDAAVFRPSTGTWYIRQSRTLTLLTILWGVSTDTPVPRDYDGDGQTDAAVFRGSTGTWYVRRSSSLTVATFEWGGATDTPVPSDYDGDGKADVSVFRPLANSWYMLQSGPAAGATMLWGDPHDVPVTGDYDGDGRSDVAVFRPSTGVWYIRLSKTAEMLSGPWGEPTDVPILELP